MNGLKASDERPQFTGYNGRMESGEKVGSMAMTPDQQFFYENAGYNYRPKETHEQGRERCGRELAIAEAYGKHEGWTIEWEQEQDVDLSWCDECADGTHDRDEHANATECAVLRDAAGNVIASLGNIDRPDDDYRRVVYAELCKEAMTPQCAIAMGCLCAGHARGDAASAPCDTNEHVDMEHVTIEPTIEQVYRALEAAIKQACDEDTRNDISDAYRRIMREQGFVDANEEE